MNDCNGVLVILDVVVGVTDCLILLVDEVELLVVLLVVLDRVDVDEPVIVLLGIAVGVCVADSIPEIEVCGDLELEGLAVDVLVTELLLEELEDAVPVFDTTGVKLYDGLAELVFDGKDDLLPVLDAVDVFVDVELPVGVIVKIPVLD